MKKNRGITYQQEIGSVVSHLRAEKGMTQAELARALGTSQPTIYRIESGRQNVSLDMVRLHTFYLTLSEGARDLYDDIPPVP